MEEDLAQKLYDKRNKHLDIHKEVDSYATWSFGLSLVGLYLCIYFFIFIWFPIIPLVLGIIGLSRINKNNQVKGKAFAIISIILSVLEFFIMAILTYFFIFLN